MDAHNVVGSQDISDWDSLSEDSKLTLLIDNPELITVERVSDISHTKFFNNFESSYFIGGLLRDIYEMRVNQGANKRGARYLKKMSGIWKAIRKDT